MPACRLRVSVKASGVTRPRPVATVSASWIEVRLLSIGFAREAGLTVSCGLDEDGEAPLGIEVSGPEGWGAHALPGPTSWWMPSGPMGGTAAGVNLKESGSEGLVGPVDGIVDQAVVEGLVQILPEEGFS